MDNFIFAEAAPSEDYQPSFQSGPFASTGNMPVAETYQRTESQNLGDYLPDAQIASNMPHALQDHDPSLVERLKTIELKLDALSSRVGSTVLESDGPCLQPAYPTIPLDPCFGAPYNHYRDSHLTKRDIIAGWYQRPALSLRPSYFTQEPERVFADAVVRIHIDQSQFLPTGARKLQRGDVVDISCTYMLGGDVGPEQDIPSGSKFFIESTQNFDSVNQNFYIRVAPYTKDGRRAQGAQTVWPDRILVVPAPFNDTSYPPFLSFLALKQTFNYIDAYPVIRASAKYNLGVMMQDLWALER